MSITSLSFLIFLAIMVVGYYILPIKRRWIWLLIGSAYFYFLCSRKVSVWLLISVMLIYLFGLWIDHCDRKYQKRMEEVEKAEARQLKKDAKRRKGYIAFFCAVIQIAIWVGFRFTDQLFTSLNRMLHGDFDFATILVPLGLSFYMLQAISYVVDVKRGKMAAQRNPFKLALWLGFFPQMLQGPIARYSETFDQLIDGNPFDRKNIKYGAQLMLWGYFKKLILSNYAGVIVDAIFGSAAGAYHGSEYMIAIGLYAVQLFGDFSGGIDIISGCAEMFGVHLPENFRRPYFSKSIQEFWQRWHITLGNWFKDYLFYPISISKWAGKTATHTRKIFGPKLGNMIPTYIALLIVWTATGIWHGAGMGYMLWGLYNGVLMVLAMQFNEPLARFAEKRLRINRARMSWRLFQIVRTFILVSLGRILFEAATVGQALVIYRSFFTDFSPWVFFDGTIFTYGLDQMQILVLVAAMFVWLAVSLLQERGVHIRDAIARQNLAFRWILYIVALFVVLIFGMYGAGYNAGDFIYMQF